MYRKQNSAKYLPRGVNDKKNSLRGTNKWIRQGLCSLLSLLCYRRAEWLRNVKQLTYAKTSVKLVNKLTHGHFATTCMQWWTTAALKNCSLQTVGLVGQIVLQTGRHCDPSLHGGQCTTGHYWHIPAAELHHHSCSVGGRVNRPEAEVVLRLESWAGTGRLLVQMPGPTLEIWALNGIITCH